MKTRLNQTVKTMFLFGIWLTFSLGVLTIFGYAAIRKISWLAFVVWAAALLISALILHYLVMKKKTDEEKSVEPGTKESTDALDEDDEMPEREGFNYGWLILILPLVIVGLFFLAQLFPGPSFNIDFSWGFLKHIPWLWIIAGIGALILVIWLLWKTKLGSYIGTVLAIVAAGIILMIVYEGYHDYKEKKRHDQYVFTQVPAPCKSVSSKKVAVDSAIVEITDTGRYYFQKNVGHKIIIKGQDVGGKSFWLTQVNKGAIRFRCEKVGSPEVNWTCEVIRDGFNPIVRKVLVNHNDGSPGVFWVTADKTGYVEVTYHNVLY